MSLDIYIFQIFPSPKKSRDEKFQNKKEVPCHLGNFNSLLPQPPPFNSRLGSGLGSDIIVCVVLFSGW